MDANGATKRADAVLRENGLYPNSYRKAAQMVDTTSPVANEFLRRRMPITDINKIYEQRVPGALWRVRYFQDSQPEEYAVVLKPDGSLHAFRHTLAESAKGSTLTKEDAIAIAEKFLQEQKQIDLSQWKLVSSDSDKKPNRTDHTLTWQQNTPLDPVKPNALDSTDHAYARIELQVLGDQPANYRTYVKIPEEFTRKQEEQSLPQTLFSIGQIGLGLALLVAVIVLFFKRLRTQPVRVPWRRLVLWGFVGLAAYAANFLMGDGIPALMTQYRTATPFRLFLATTTVGV